MPASVVERDRIRHGECSQWTATDIPYLATFAELQLSPPVMTSGEMATVAHPAEYGAGWPATAREQDAKAVVAPEPPARDLVDGYISMLKNAYDDRPKYKGVRTP